MPLLFEDGNYTPETLTELLQELTTELEETRQLIQSPRGPVRDPVSLGTADALVVSVLDEIRREGSTDPAVLIRRANLAYATLLATIDLVKSHTDVPRVPQHR